MRFRSAPALLAVTAAASACAIGAAGPALAQESSRAESGHAWGVGTTAGSKAATVKVAKTSDGPLLVTGSGYTLYLFTADGRDADRCVKVSGCASAWPPLTVSGKPTAGTGAKASLLGTITISGGRRQVTYAGHPLYRYAGDSSAGATGYIGASSFGGTWLGVSATGTSVK